MNQTLTKGGTLPRKRDTFTLTTANELSATIATHMSGFMLIVR